MRQRRFKSANYPVAERRHLLEAGTEWISGTGGIRVRLIRLDEFGMALIARIRPGDHMPPRGVWLATRSLLRNYRREDEA